MRFLVSIALITAVAVDLPAADWPWFGGPGSSRSADYDGGLITDAEQARLVWESADAVPTSHPDKPKGSTSGGFSSPVLADGRLYVFYFVPAGAVAGDADKRRAKDKSSVDKWRIGASDVVHCFDAKTGKTLWKRVYENKGINYNNESAKVGGHFTPAVGGGRVFAIGTTGRVYAMDAVTGEPKWEAHIGGKHESMEAAKAKGLAANRMPVSKRFGINDVPAYSGGAVAMGNGNGGVIAFDADSGKRLWSLPPCLPKYSGPVPWVCDGRAYFLVVGRKGSATRLIEPKTGEVVWESTQVIHDKPFAGLSEGYLVTGNGGAAKKGFAEDEGLYCYRIDATGVKPAWSLIDPSDGKYGILKTQCPVIMNGHVFVVCGRKNNTKIRLVCVELATGKKTDEFQLPAGSSNWWSSIGGGGGLIFQETAHRVEMYAAEPGKVRHLGTMDNTKITNTVGPIFADGFLYLRGYDRLRCYDLRR